MKNLPAPAYSYAANPTYSTNPVAHRNPSRWNRYNPSWRKPCEPATGQKPNERLTQSSAADEFKSCNAQKRARNLSYFGKDGGKIANPGRIETRKTSDHLEVLVDNGAGMKEGLAIAGLHKQSQKDVIDPHSFV